MGEPPALGAGGRSGNLRMERPLVSVVVVNYNRARLLAECLDSLLGQTWRPLEIVVVDNGSDDASRSEAAARFPGGVRLVELDGNRGFAAGANAGIAASRGQLVALLNNDAVAEPNWVERLAEAMLASDSVGMCASKILLYGSDVIDKAGHQIFPDGQNRGRGSGSPDRGQFDRLEETLFPDGCAALYRRGLLAETEGFDEDFFAYGDDADLGLRARWLGWDCLYVPGAVARHRQSSTSGVYSSRKVYWVERNRLWVAIKNFPPPLLALNPVLTAYRWGWNLAAAAAGRGAAGNFRRRTSWREMAATLVRAVVDGARMSPVMWRKRRRVRKARRLSDWEFLRLLWRHRITARALALRDPDRSE